ncbi:MAG: 1-acyl-sn-glycerol-3-phosphate acyltransferase [Gammaproteobacteria bacterium]|nr:1-acyl-sn-glycerol-3-phosphate acyltransferase [Gammaproteobacteria bacterium]MBU1481383.1 1-acyl-sn-glycerol-3-phosphate acyltransferase [Gammaproteobacteria bacterium]
MIFIRSLVFFLAQLIWTPIFATLVLPTFPLKPHTRYRIATKISNSTLWLLRVICGIRMEVRGAENIPKQPCIVMCKHQSAWETFALQLVFPDQVWVLKRELLLLPFFGWGLALTSPIAIDRSKGKQAMKQLLEQGKDRLERGFCVVIFPEGTRMPYGVRGKYKIGGAMLGESSGAPVVPVAHNAGKFWGRNSFLKHPGTIVMSIGQPVDPKGLKAEEINRRVEDWIEGEMIKLG